MSHIAPSDNSTPCIRSRPFRDENDWLRGRNLLIETYPIMPLDWNWEIRRWDGWRYHSLASGVNPTPENLFRLWETEEGHLVGVVHPEGQGDAYLEIHPDYRQLIEEDMLTWAEQNLAMSPSPDSPPELQIFINEYDIRRLSLAQERGFVRMDEFGVSRRMRLGYGPLPAVDLHPGYTLRSTRPGDEGDCQRMADVLNAGFNRTRHTAAEYRNLSANSPSFRHDLNLVAEVPDGSFAAHVGLTLDEVNRRAIFEPVCTCPAHRRKGLARSLMIEGLHRLRRLGALEATVGTGDMGPANALYDSIGFTEIQKGYMWRKVYSDVRS